MNAAPIAPRDRLLFTLFLALALHAALILGITFTTRTEPPVTQAIEVTVSRYDEEVAPNQADFIAATNQQGSGSASEVVETTARRETEFISQAPAELAPLPPEQEAQPEDRRAIISTSQPAETRAAADPEVAADPLDSAAPQHRISFDRLAEEIAGLEARIAKEQEAQANRPRIRRLTSVSARSAVEAGYLSAWRQRVERVGNANYPGGGVEGNLRMLVIIRFDGSLEEVRLLESSGHRALDQAALRIIRLAAPFPAFPVDMRKHYDQLEIIRTWQFSRRGNRLEG
jgi:protein TonB